MAREMNKLAARFVATVKAPGKYRDGGGLVLLVKSAEIKRWVLVYDVNGARREMGLGPLSLVSLGEARDLRDDARKLLQKGGDPLEARRSEAANKAAEAARLAALAEREAAPRFGAYAKAMVADMTFGSEKHRKAYERRTAGLLPTLQDLRLDAITSADVVAALKPQWKNTPDQAERCRGQIERVLDRARAGGLIEGPWENPARWRGRIEFLLPRVERLVVHHKALPHEEIGGFMARLRARPGVGALALEFTILTCGRTNETRFCRRGEIDLDAKVWVIPAARMKMKREHRVPLTDAALAILAKVAVHEINDPDAFVFPNAKRKALSSGTMERVLDRMNVAVTVHGFRSTFRDWAGSKTTHARDLIEMCLAHAVGDSTERAYRRDDYVDRRRVVLEDWAKRCGDVEADKKPADLKEAA